MDGARFANAVASLGLAPKEITWKVGVDVLCFGGTKGPSVFTNYQFARKGCVFKPVVLKRGVAATSQPARMLAPLEVAAAGKPVSEKTQGSVFHTLALLGFWLYYAKY